MLYQAIGNSRLFNCYIKVEAHSIINVVFIIGSDSTDKAFI
jgi:hypothetical protein